ncbi:hypothetical protein EI067_11650 [Mycobacterium paragordonae]|uniref:hypothetical protein n=1 Tax=Mycobacterium paragordonae TaxID=1389713 RepID=UPI00105C47D6|nr:hypothetical protein [Mycobacterium paragordonae]TDK97685.1 hypothetical protein EI067_11650 [Mycobacterium paragordonae]
MMRSASIICRSGSIRFLFVIVWLLPAFAGCSSKPPAAPSAPSSSITTPSGYQLPHNISFSEHWFATPAVDLMSAEGTYIRAYIEGDHVASNNVDRADGSYPGFATAAHDRSFNWLGTGLPSKGFFTNWVHELTLAPDGSAVAVVCYAGAVDVEFPNDYGIFKRTITFQRAGAAPPADQKGTARAPLVSVFGNWYTSNFETGPFMDPDCATNPPPVDKSPVPTPGWPDHPAM